MSEFTLDEAIKVLRQHNVTGASVLRITRGQALEKDLLSQVLNSCEQLISEKAEYKRLLKAAFEAMNSEIGYCSNGCQNCAYSPAGSRECADYGYKWVHTDEALKLMGEDGDTECQ